MAKKRSTGTGMGVLAVFGVVALVAGLAVLVGLRAKNKPQTKVVKGLTTGSPEQKPIAKPREDPELDLYLSGDPLVVDVDGDHTDDFIVYEGAAYVAISTRQHRVLWRTEPMTPPGLEGRFAWVAGKSLIVTRGPDLTAYALATGARTHRVGLGGAVVRPCASPPERLARATLASGTFDYTNSGTRMSPPQNTASPATFACAPVPTDAADANPAAALNARALACDASVPECAKRLPRAALPKDFAPREAWFGAPGTDETTTVFGTRAEGSAMLIGLRDKGGQGPQLAWRLLLDGAPVPDGYTPNPFGGEDDDGAGLVAPGDPALLGWYAAMGRVLVLRRYTSPRGGRTVVEGLDDATGERIFSESIDGHVSGIRYLERDDRWVFTTNGAIWDLMPNARPRLLIGRD